MAESTDDRQSAEEKSSDQPERRDPDTENTFTFGEVQWTSNLHSSAKRPTSEEEAPPR